MLTLGLVAVGWLAVGTVTWAVLARSTEGEERDPVGAACVIVAWPLALLIAAIGAAQDR